MLVFNGAYRLLQTCFATECLYMREQSHTQVLSRYLYNRHLKSTWHQLHCVFMENIELFILDPLATYVYCAVKSCPPEIYRFHGFSKSKERGESWQDTKVHSEIRFSFCVHLLICLLGILSNTEKAIEDLLCPGEISHNCKGKLLKNANFVWSVDTRSPDVNEARKKKTKGSQLGELKLVFSEHSWGDWATKRARSTDCHENLWKGSQCHCLLLDGMPKHEGEENTQFSYERKKHLPLNHTIVKPSFMIFVGLSFKNIICVRIHSFNAYLLSAFYVLDTVVSVCDASVRKIKRAKSPTFIRLSLKLEKSDNKQCI